MNRKYFIPPTTLILLIICLIPFTLSAHTVYYNILDYGAKKDGKTISTEPIQAAIEACFASGGGTVWFPAGRYISGTIYLRSHVTLLLDAGAVLEGSTNLKDYPVNVAKIRSYTDNYTDKSLIYGEDLEDIAITGEGTINGNGASFEINGPYKVRPYLMRIINCKKVRVKDVTILNSPMWVQHYLACDDVIISGITVNSRVNANNDGIDIDGCDNVRISDCNIVSGDDAIVFKSTLDKSCHNITVTNCQLSSDCNAIKMGTETNGGFQDIVITNCTISDTHLAGITLQIVDGGTLAGVIVSNVTMRNVGDAIFIRLGNRARPYMDNMPKPGMGKLSDVIIANVNGTNIGRTGCSITGLPGFMASNITLSNICLTFEGGGKADLANREVPELPEAYPEHNMFSNLPSYGFYCRHIKNLRLDNIELAYAKPEARHAMIFDDVENLELNGLRAQTEGTVSVIGMTGVKKALLQSCVAADGTGTFLELNAVKSSNISLIGNDLSRAKRTCQSENHSSVFFEGNRMASETEIPEGSYVNCDMKYTDDRKIRICTPAEAASKRIEIIRAIWGTGQIPDRSDVIVTRDTKSPLDPSPFVSRVDRFEIPVNAPVSEGAAPIKDLAYFFVPPESNNRLIIFNPGHSCKLSTQQKNDPGLETAIKGLLEEGFEVLAVFMPHVSDTSCYLTAADHCKIINTDLGTGVHPATYGLRFFLEPEIVCLNYLLKNNNYHNINMIGLSGGGWTTNLLAAIDERIKYSFSVAGSMPLYYRSGGSRGDIEQFLPELYRDIAGYPDLYVLGAYGKGRKQVQILNRNDDCCFGQNQHAAERDYDRDLKTFEASVKEKLRDLESDGHYYLVIDEMAQTHQISSYALKNVILKELIKK